ncbi:hypothetical protein PHYPO_G00217230 [Pangasianodon hypophthalmus]|uniref:Uncharacterized protein n=1 Tax=Pangasianodon hypophthalmus TaxID=310915 RepID=A0A5N5P870_PANHP|nr:hypothetical protein PHYPO_G00217230 [Pangasianodon hypophthalmus]
MEPSCGKARVDKSCELLAQSSATCSCRRFLWVSMWVSSGYIPPPRNMQPPDVSQVLEYVLFLRCLDLPQKLAFEYCKQMESMQRINRLGKH